MTNVNFNRYLFEYTKNNLLIVIFFVILLFVYPLQKIYMPKYYGKTINSLQNNKNFGENIKTLLLFYIFIQFLFTIIYRIQGHMVPQFTEYSTTKIYETIINGFEYSYDNIQSGEILTKLLKVPNVVYDYMEVGRVLIFSQCIILGTAFFHYNNVSSLCGMVFLLLTLGVILLQYISYRNTIDIELKRENEQGVLYEHINDVLQNLVSVYVCQQKKYENDYMKEKFKVYNKVFIESLHINFLLRIFFGIYNIIAFIALNYVIYLAYKNKKINKEGFISSFIITWSILGVYLESHYASRKIVDAYSQIKDIEDYFNIDMYKDVVKSNVKKEETVVNKNVNKFINGDIVLSNVYHKYKGSEKFSLEDISFTIKKGEKIALVGQIGSGKSTIIKMLMKLQPTIMGNITIDGKSLSSLDSEMLRKNMFYIPQKPKLLNRTLYENIIYGIPKNKVPTEKDIETFLLEMDLKEVNDVFKSKMNKKLGVDAISISGGQKQIVWLLRAFFRNTPIIILDEPTASLDPKSKELVVNTLKKMGIGKTIIVVTHDDIDSSFRKITFHDGKLKKSKFSSFYSMKI